MMSKFLVINLALVLGISMLVPMLSSTGFATKGVSEPEGVYCEINEVKLFAQTAEDCEKVGGVVTHTVTTIVKPAGDNSNQEPEIQRDKDKEPEAP